MFKRINLAIIFVLVFALAVGAFQDANWIKVSPIGAGFSVLMPAQPEEEIKPGDDFTSHLFSITTDKIIYLAGYGEYAPGINFSAETELKTNRDIFLKGLNATLLASKQVTWTVVRDSISPLRANKRLSKAAFIFPAIAFTR